MPPDSENTDSMPNRRDSTDHRARIAETYGREYPRLLSSMRRKVPPEDAADIVSNAFTRLLAHPSEPIGVLAAYVHRIAANLLANHYRDKEGRLSKLILLESEHPDSAPSPESVLIEQQLLEVLEDVVSRFEPPQRMAFLLRREGLSLVEIADRFAEEGEPISIRTVQRYLEQSYEICRQELQERSE